MLRRSAFLRFPTVAVLLFLTGCGSSQGEPTTPTPAVKPTFHQAEELPVCLVLSGGGPKGLAHIGAIQAIAANTDLKIGCVAGTSMGALIGSMYVTAPQDDIADRYQGFMRAYEEKTKDEAGGRGFFFALLGLATGGLGWAAAAGVVGASSTDRVNLKI